MSLVVAFFILINILLAPALAIYPRLLQNPLTACAIPIVSGLLSFGIASTLISFHCYSTWLVNLISALFILIAIFRCIHFFRNNSCIWSYHDLYLLTVNFILLLPLITITYFSAFSTNDEIYSWGMWALQHYRNEAPSYMLNGSVYPQLFPILMSYCFKLIGNVEFQAAVKLTFLIFPLTIMQVIAASSKKFTRVLLFYIILIFCSVFPWDFYAFYSKAYADPLMIASLITSITFFVFYINTSQKHFLWLSVVCGISASLTKQPGLWWSLIVFPSWVTFRMIRLKKMNIVELMAIILMIYPPLLWLAEVNFSVFHNQTVLNASFQHRSLFSQLSHAIWEYFIKTPTILLLVLLAGAAVCKKSIVKVLFFTLVIPYLLMWFLLGAYQLRLGVHVTVLCGLIIAISGGSNFQFHFLNRSKQVLYSLFGISALISFICFIKLNYFNEYDIFPTQGGKTTLNSMYGKDGQFVFSRIYNNLSTKVWIGDPFNYGVLYGHANLLYPDNYFVGHHYELQDLVNDIKFKKPLYIISPGRTPSRFKGLVEQLVKMCPYDLKKVAEGNSQYQFVVYEVNKTLIPACF